MVIVVPVALIGLLVGLILVPFYLGLAAHHGKKGQRVLDALAQGGLERARQVLDEEYPSEWKVGPLSVVSRRQRLAGLALLGDSQRIEEELPRFTGPKRSRPSSTCATASSG